VHTEWRKSSWTVISVTLPKIEFRKHHKIKTNIPFVL
jgi:hypothetical protein